VSAGGGLLLGEIADGWRDLPNPFADVFPLRDETVEEVSS
jgi:hypothetical protein